MVIPEDSPGVGQGPTISALSRLWQPFHMPAFFRETLITLISNRLFFKQFKPHYILTRSQYAKVIYVSFKYFEISSDLNILNFYLEIVYIGETV